MKNWRQILIPPSASILRAIETIDQGALQIALITDAAGRLLGTVTDGDVRRGILRGVALDRDVAEIMNTAPITASSQDTQETILATMKQRRLQQIPILDRDGLVIGVQVLADLLRAGQKDNWVVLMAGGLGTRLAPLTNETPKPLLKVGTKPLLETIMQNFIEYGFHKFYLSVNYKAEMIRDYFGDGSRFGVEIRYVHEEKRMGTAGALSLLPERPEETFFVMNGDLLTKVNFQQLLDFHHEHGATGTMCVREYDFQIPYGVVKTDKHRLQGIVEKPVEHFFVNAGIYVLEPECIDLIPQDSFYDMPSLFEQLIGRQSETSVFPIREYWMDIGQIADYERANGEFAEVFLDRG
ncbi:CBS domain protein [Tumebacillus sp. BK434]|uniref:nucleotidyltransferase family protein n=1 Tax=Tumebacillus sp. BK434 TaxID=2512169 RepID=UPI00104BC4CA|nr:nucleotidyltransferase family protein [Tumebacillus sp. BK434]TCP57850.1 CBS domain protein [Tumebacillus sp. BK434]